MPLGFASAQRFEEVTFQELSLAEAEDLSGKILIECRFERCGLREGVLTATRMIDCVFEQCDLSMIQIGAAVFKDCQFENCRLLGIDWGAAEELVGLRFRNSTLNHNLFSGASPKDLIIAECTVREAIFEQSDLKKSDFRQSDFSGTTFVDCDLRGADFREAKGVFLDPLRNRMNKARFSLPEAVDLLRAMEIDLDG